MKLDHNVSKPLVLYEEPGYRVFRTRWRRVKIEQEKTQKTDKEVFTWWSAICELNYYATAYAGRSRGNKLAVNKQFADRGKTWIQHWKAMVAGEMWEVRCGNWDGLGTPCPLQKEMADGEMGCPYTFFFMGYSGGTPKRRVPGLCDGPLNGHTWSEVCAPVGEDKHGFTMNHMARARNEIYNRGQP